MSNEKKDKTVIRQMKVSPMLSKILSESLVQAKINRHEFFTPEHVLAVALQTEIQQIL